MTAPCQEIEGLIARWEALAAHLPRGEDHAAVCVKFFGGGGKGDLDSGLYMGHSKASCSMTEKAQWDEVQDRLRNLLEVHVVRALEVYFFDLLDFVQDAFHRVHLARTYVRYWSCMTCGHLFWNRP